MPKEVTDTLGDTDFAEHSEFEIVSSIKDFLGESFLPAVQFDGFDVVENLIHGSSSFILSFHHLPLVLLVELVNHGIDR